MGTLFALSHFFATCFLSFCMPHHSGGNRGNVRHPAQACEAAVGSAALKTSGVKRDVIFAFDRKAGLIVYRLVLYCCAYVLPAALAVEGVGPGCVWMLCADALRTAQRGDAPTHWILCRLKSVGSQQPPPHKKGKPSRYRG